MIVQFLLFNILNACNSNSSERRRKNQVHVFVHKMRQQKQRDTVGIQKIQVSSSFPLSIVQNQQMN